MHDKVLILDFGSQVTQLIARRVREAQVYCEIHPNDVGDAFIKAFNPKAIILSGSHASTYEDHELRAPDQVWRQGVPVLGICYGMQTMAVQLGGQVGWSDQREFGYAEVRALGHTQLLSGLQDFFHDGHAMLKVWMSHGDKVTQLPAGFKLMAATPSCPIAGMADEQRRFYAVQFHPEVTHTVQGSAMLRRFVRDIAGCAGDWQMGSYIDEAVARIRAQVGDEEVILGLSGGVDSSVAAALIHRAIGEQLTCVFVDHGLLRLNEGDLVMEMFAGKLHAKVIRIDASANSSWASSPASPTPSASARSSAPSSSRCSRPRRPSWARRAGWRRAPSTPTWWKAVAPRPRRPPPSRAITTWAACPRPSG
jgi:GMP synthase (glutamine-hydrolysing)